MYASSCFEQDDGANLRFFFYYRKEKEDFFSLCHKKKRVHFKIAHPLCRVQITYLKLLNFA